MRRAQLHAHIEQLIVDTFGKDNPDVGAAILADTDPDGAFGALCHRLDQAGDGQPTKIRRAWEQLARPLSDRELDWLADQADNPAAWLASRI